MTHTEHPQKREVYQGWIDAIIIEAEHDILDTWEINFIESVFDQLERMSYLTQAQAEKLEDIYVRCISTNLKEKK